jgi:DNA-binding MarR family transcriptional regulator
MVSPPTMAAFFVFRPSPTASPHLAQVLKQAYSEGMPSDQTDSAAYLAGQLAKGFSRSLQLRAAELGFSPGHLPILIELWAEDGLTQSQLLERIDIEQPTMANTLSRMQKAALIERRAHPTDRRAQLIFLTDRAKAMESDARRAAEEAEEALFAGFRLFEKELMLEYMRRALGNARKP